MSAATPPVLPAQQFGTTLENCWTDVAACVISGALGPDASQIFGLARSIRRHVLDLTPRQTMYRGVCHRSTAADWISAFRTVAGVYTTAEITDDLLLDGLVMEKNEQIMEKKGNLEVECVRCRQIRRVHFVPELGLCFSCVLQLLAGHDARQSLYFAKSQLIAIRNVAPEWSDPAWEVMHLVQKPEVNDTDAPMQATLCVRTGPNGFQLGVFAYFDMSVFALVYNSSSNAIDIYCVRQEQFDIDSWWDPRIKASCHPRHILSEIIDILYAFNIFDRTCAEAAA